ncbi:MAG: YitT family protein [Candidatus Binatia bacterium]
MRRSPARRLPGLIAGLSIFGVGIAFMAQSELGLGPWEAFHQGISRQSGLELGTVSILVGIPVLALWWPLGQRPGIGTVLNMALVGTMTNVALRVVPAPGSVGGRIALMLGGVVLIGIASGIYLSADLGAGPRDGLMTALHHRFGWSIALVRTTMEVTVLAIGWLLGGTVGLGTVVFAFGIGPIVQRALAAFDRDGVVLRKRTMLDAAE